MACRFDNAADEFHFDAPAKPFSVCGWGKVTVDRNDYSILTSWNTGGTEWVFGATADGTTIMLYDGNAENNVTGITVGTWFFWAWTVDSSQNWKAYVATDMNATLTVVSGTGTGGTNTKLQFGNDSSAEFLNGCLDNVIVFSSVLAQADIEVQRSRRLPLTNQYAWWPMLNNASPIDNALVDYSGNGRTITLSGAITFEDGGPVPWGASRPQIPTASTPTSDIIPSVNVMRQLRDPLLYM